MDVERRFKRRDTPNEKRKGENPLACSPWRRGTPVKRNDNHLKQLTYQNGAQCLPFHMTPPSKLRKFITKNPFEPDLINRLHLSTISPTVFAKVPSPAQHSPGFTWSIEELAHMKPARIEDSPVHQVHSPDLELETRAQAAIDRFFKQNQIIPSPWDVKQEGKPLLALDTPNRLLNDLNSTQEPSKMTKDAWSQTILSLPLDLPSNVEEVLKPFFNFTQEQNVDSDDVNSSNNSLRRKLFFCHDEGTDNDESFTSLSPVKMNESMALSCSPPQSGMFVHGTPLKRLQTRRRSNRSSIVMSENLSPPNMSPIHEAENNRLYERVEHCSSATRLNFMIDMSTDDIAERKDQSSVNGYHSLDMSSREIDVKRTGDSDKLIIINNDKTNACDSINMEELPKCINSTDNIVHSSAVVFSDKEHNKETASFSRENHKRSNIMSGAFEQQSISNSVQDTGYQTHSMNSAMCTIDSYNTSTNHKTLWNEKIAMSKDYTQLSWRENIRNVFSSTPSKHNKKSGT
ncbi:protein aurora borealis-like [Temnothorax curvispinosus]|uniref:Protein aurora borealis n=1 Tax=Temnothorax curvispinosus TaxID=300111 RepID=A0A6J1QI81_9HYME|nr:protein aurora borealis-like [Temnothorax curvispinosus]